MPPHWQCAPPPSSPPPPKHTPPPLPSTHTRVPRPRPPAVTRLIPWSKYKYELEKADKVRKKATTQTETKEIRMRPATDVHDFNVKVKSAQKFIEKVGRGGAGNVTQGEQRGSLCRCRRGGRACAGALAEPQAAGIRLVPPPPCPAPSRSAWPPAPAGLPRQADNAV
jgi:hypothetical protein